MRVNYIKSRIFSCFLIACVSHIYSVGELCAEDPSPSSSIVLNGFIDTYADHDFNDPFTKTRPYTTQALYDDQARINLGMLESKYTGESARAKLTIQGGDSVKSNYAAEEDLFWRYIQEANFGVKLTDQLWFDAGIYTAHVGFESFVSRDNWNYTRSLVAEYSPYYESGGKLTYQVSDTFSAQFNLVHGWQNISSSAEPMFGLQLNYLPDSVSKLTYANLLGHQNGGYRTFHDFIASRDISESWSVAAQFDLGTQNRENDDCAIWHGWTLITKYKVRPKVSLGGRIERYVDPHQVIATSLSGHSFNVLGLSLNVDYEILKDLFWRTEYRALIGSNDIFPSETDNSYRASDSLVVTSLSYTFNLVGLEW